MKELDLNFAEMRVGLMAKLWEAMRPLLSELQHLDELEELLKKHTGLIAKAAPKPTNGKRGRPPQSLPPPAERRRSHPSREQLESRDQVLLDLVKAHPGIETPELVKEFKKRGLMPADRAATESRRLILKTAAALSGQIRMERTRHPFPYSFFPTDGKFHPRAEPSKTTQEPTPEVNPLLQNILTHLAAEERTSAIELTAAALNDGFPANGKQLRNSVSYHLRRLVADGVVKRHSGGSDGRGGEHRPEFSVVRPRVSVQKTD